ncbi:MAG TPA: serine hydrolase [Actinomycetes bacterium]|nr:serine hydrolase [Actinomycetes bacterium]
MPQQLESASVPGLVIAPIHQGKVTREAGFGVTNTLTGDPVTKDSAFEVASLGKPAAAHAALRLADLGQPTPWTSAAESTGQKSMARREGPP